MIFCTYATGMLYMPCTDLQYIDANTTMRSMILPRYSFRVHSTILFRPIAGQPTTSSNNPEIATQPGTSDNTPNLNFFWTWDIGRALPTGLGSSQRHLHGSEHWQMQPPVSV